VTELLEAFNALGIVKKARVEGLEVKKKYLNCLAVCVGLRRFNKGKNQSAGFLKQYARKNGLSGVEVFELFDFSERNSLTNEGYEELFSLVNEDEGLK